MARIILGLGSNLGDRLEHLQFAVNEISNFTDIDKISSVYETPPFEMEAEFNFLNICISGVTELSPEDLLAKCQLLERERGRIKTAGATVYESRPLDIDILYYDDRIISSKELQVPHPELHKRRFVLEPLSEILSEHFDPLRKLKISELVTKLEDNSTIHKIVQRIEVNK